MKLLTKLKKLLSRTRPAVRIPIIPAHQTPRYSINDLQNEILQNPDEYGHPI